ncbi:hypothetical protein V6S67_08125 [Arthrobacter sp. Soc17.1.1.1]|uniref:PIN-like domain-containing protein n=1 Tax=Arthrobacter sp. Soc17.1.1.1 TaxID=3121277 RepID=UPI002FE43D2B
MRCFIDENLHTQLVDILQALSPATEFSHAHHEQLSGYDDEDLIPEVARRGFDVLITDDRRQMVNLEELAALQRSGMHWVSLVKVNVFGMHGLGATTATLVAALPHLLDIHQEEQVPQRIRLKGRGRERSQVLTHRPL